MEKLISLLNEFKEGAWYSFTGYDDEYWMFDTDLNMDGNTSLPEETITCKKFWFIKWLVDNDKIDYYKVGEIVDTYKWSLREKAYVVSDCVVESMLILLAIQDDPISFLISILR